MLSVKIRVASRRQLANVAAAHCGRGKEVCMLSVKIRVASRRQLANVVAAHCSREDGTIRTTVMKNSKRCMSGRHLCCACLLRVILLPSRTHQSRGRPSVPPYRC